VPGASDTAIEYQLDDRLAAHLRVELQSINSEQPGGRGIRSPEQFRVTGGAE
jgi:hypothetical protein